ncbi:MAG: hypothetical protein JWP91_4554 [Fibrobacteres bacterium]|nr:hypothetical protein [Fibrobacterota bacterium]
MASFLATLILTAIFIAILGETWARIACLPAIGSVLERDPYKKIVLTQSPRGIVPPTALSTVRWGVRGDEPPGDWARWNTLIAIGGGSTLCYHLDDHKTWPYLLQERMRAAAPRTWIGNAGQEGVTAVSAGILMDVLIRRLRPSTVILMAGESDLSLSFTDERRERGSPYDRAFEKRVARELDKSSFRERSRLFREFNLWKRRRAASLTILDQPADDNRFPAPLALPEDSLPVDSLLQTPLTGFGLNILRVHDLARATGTRVLFLTHPYLYGTDPAWVGREARNVQFHEREYRISAATERSLLDRFNARLLDLCAANRLECLDIAPGIPNDSLHFYDESHLTETGAARVAEILAGYFRDHPASP